MKNTLVRLNWVFEELTARMCIYIGLWAAKILQSRLKVLMKVAFVEHFLPLPEILLPAASVTRSAWRKKYPGNQCLADQITNMSLSGSSIWNCGQQVTSASRLMEHIKASASNIIRIPHFSLAFLYSVSYWPYKELFYIQSNKGTAGSQKIPSHHRVCVSNAD